MSKITRLETAEERKQGLASTHATPSGDSPKTNLPPSTTTFVGREADLSALDARFQEGARRSQLKAGG